MGPHRIVLYARKQLYSSSIFPTAFVIDKSLALQVGIPVAVLVIIAVILAIYVK